MECAPTTTGVATHAPLLRLSESWKALIPMPTSVPLNVTTMLAVVPTARCESQATGAVAIGAIVSLATVTWTVPVATPPRPSLIV